MFNTDLDSDDNASYRCKVAALDIWNTGEQFSNQKIEVSFLRFSSEYVLRKQGWGWRMLIKVKNHSDQILVAKRLTVFEKKSQKWIEHKNRYTVLEIRKGTSITQKQLNVIQLIHDKNALLDGILCDNDWYREMNNSHTSSDANNSDLQINQVTRISKIWKKRKTGSWIWVNSQKNAPTSNDQNCRQKKDKGAYSVDDKKIEKLSKEGVIPWKISKSDADWSVVKNKFEERDQLGEGKWINAEEICGLSNERKWNASEEQFKNLKIFCAKSRD